MSLWEKFHSEVLEAQSCLTLYDPMDYIAPRLLCPWNSPGKNTGVGSNSPLKGLFPTQGSNPGLPHALQADSLQSEPTGKPMIEVAPKKKKLQ